MSPQSAEIRISDLRGRDAFHARVLAAALLACKSAREAIDLTRMTPAIAAYLLERWVELGFCKTADVDAAHLKPCRAQDFEAWCAMPLFTSDHGDGPGA